MEHIYRIAFNWQHFYLTVKLTDSNYFPWVNGLNTIVNHQQLQQVLSKILSLFLCISNKAYPISFQTLKKKKEKNTTGYDFATF